MKRYDMRVDNPSIEDDQGDWVRYNDVAPLVEALRGALESINDGDAQSARNELTAALNTLDAKERGE